MGSSLLEAMGIDRDGFTLYMNGVPVKPIGEIRFIGPEEERTEDMKKKEWMTEETLTLIKSHLEWFDQHMFSPDDEQMMINIACGRLERIEKLARKLRKMLEV